MSGSLSVSMTSAMLQSGDGRYERSGRRGEVLVVGKLLAEEGMKGARRALGRKKRGKHEAGEDKTLGPPKASKHHLITLDQGHLPLNAA